MQNAYNCSVYVVFMFMYLNWILKLANNWKEFDAEFNLFMIKSKLVILCNILDTDKSVKLFERSIHALSSLDNMYKINAITDNNCQN